MSTIKEFTFTVPAKINPGATADTSNHARLSATCNVLAIPTADGESAILAATDGRTLSLVPVACANEAPESPVLLPAKPCKGGAKDTTVTVNGEVRTTSNRKTTVTENAEQSGRFPQISLVCPKPSDVAQYRPIKLDVKLLANLATALTDTGSITLWLPPANEKTGETTKPLVVIGRRESDGQIAVGLIVPLTSDKQEDVPDDYAELVGQIPSGAFKFGD